MNNIRRTGSWEDIYKGREHTDEVLINKHHTYFRFTK